MSEYLPLLLAAAFAAGFIDAIAGGGGLIQLPALLLAFPSMDIPVKFGTNKCSSVFGTLAAIPQFARRVRFEPKLLLFALIPAFVLSFFGAMAVNWLANFNQNYFKPFIVFMLLAVALYTYLKKDLGSNGTEDGHENTNYTLAASIGGGIGFYDGFFGPGTGSFLIFALVRYMGFNFLSATAYAKTINAATNLGALTYFISHGQVSYAVALPMAGCNILGATLGARLAILRGNRFIRGIFLVMILLIIGRLAYDMAK